MESKVFNLSVLENATTFSTPLKDCSDYEAILSLIKEEIDVSQTEDDVDHQGRPSNASRPTLPRSDTEPSVNDNKFRLPYGKNHSAKTKSPRTAMFSRTKRRSCNDSKNYTREHVAYRARTLGRSMPRRSLKSNYRQQRSSCCYSDTSRFSGFAENRKTLNRKNLSPRKQIDYDATDAYETEAEALEDLLSMAQEQVIVNGSPWSRNSTVSSQYESTSLATSDPLDTKAMEEECYVESSQPIYVSDFREKLLNHRNSCVVPKTVEMIKRNLHFSDAPDSEEDNQNFSLALSPETTPLLNENVDGKSAPVASRTRKGSQDSVASILNSLLSSSSHFFSQREASTTPPWPQNGKSSKDSISQEFNSSISNLNNSYNQKEASMTTQPSSMSKTSEESTPDIQNLTYDLPGLERKTQASSTPQACKSRTSRESTPCTVSTLNLTHDLEEFEPKREASTTPEPCTGRTRQSSLTSTASTVNLPHDFQYLEPKAEKSTPQHSYTSESSQGSIASTIKDLTRNLLDFDSVQESSTTRELSSIGKTNQHDTPSTLENLGQNLQDFNLERVVSTALQTSSMSETNESSTPGIMKNIPQNLLDLNAQRQASTTLAPSTMHTTSPDSRLGTLQKLVQDLHDSNSKMEANTALQPSNMSRACQDSTFSTPENVAQNLHNFDSESETSATLPHHKKRKTSQSSTVSARTNSNRETEYVDGEREETDVSSLHHGKPTKISQDGIERTSESLTQTSRNSHNQRQTSPTSQSFSIRKASSANIVKSQGLQNFDPQREAIAVPPRSRDRKTSQDCTANSQESLTEDLQNLDFEREAIATPPYPRQRRTSQHSMASSQNNFAQDSSNFNSVQEAMQVTPQSPQNQKTSQASTASSEKSPTQDSSNLNSAKEVSTTAPEVRHRKTSQDSISNSQESLPKDLQNSNIQRKASATPSYLTHRRTSQNSMTSSHHTFTQRSSNFDSVQEARQLTPARPRKRKTSQASTTSFADSPTRDLCNIDSAQELGLPPPHLRKQQKDKGTIASPPNIMIQGLADLVPNREPSVTPQRPRKIASSVVSPLKGLTQELANCIMHVDFDRLCDEIGNDTESPSFTFETVQLLDDYNDCNSGANNKILSKILVSPNSKTDEEAPRSVEHIGSSEDPLDYDPLYITEAEDNDTMSPTTSSGREKRGTRQTENEIKSFPVDKSVKESERKIDSDDTLKEGFRRSSRSRKKRETMTLSDWEDEVDLSEKPTKVPKKIKSSIKDPLDYNALYITEAKDNKTATPSSSKRKDKPVTKNKGKKRKRLPIDDSYKSSIRKIDEDDTLEEGVRCSSRTKKRRVTVTMSDSEEEADILNKAAKVAEKVEAAMAKEHLSSETLEKLDNIVVQLRHPVVPQHDIEPCAGSATLTYEQQMQFLEFASLNKDTYSTAEDKIIKRNWNAFCEDHGWNPQNYRVFLQFKHGDQLIMSSMEERRKFVQFLADGLPNRPLYSVYNRFKKIYSEYANAGEWYTPEEDKKILAHMLFNPKKKPETKFVELSKVLKRPRQSIWKRYCNLKQKKNLDEKPKNVSMKVQWRLPLVTEFITKLLDVTISEDLMELKDAFIPIVVWRKLEAKMKIDHKFMKRSWEQQFHLQFFCPEPLSANATKIRLIEYMWMKGIRDGSEIEWHVVVKYFDGCTISFLRKMFNHLTAEASVAVESRHLSDIMKWLHDIKIDRLRRSRNDHYLPRLRYVDKEVEIVPEDTTKVTLISGRASLD